MSIVIFVNQNHFGQPMTFLKVSPDYDHPKMQWMRIKIHEKHFKLKFHKTEINCIDDDKSSCSVFY